MKRKFKKLALFSFMLSVLAVVFSVNVTAASLDYSGGSSSNGTGASATTSGFSVSYDDPIKSICGYRFSIVTSSGTPKSGTKVINVYLDNVSEGSTAYSSGQRFIVSSGVVANKKQLANGTSVTSTTSKQSCDYKSSGCGFYSTLPQDPSSMGSWIKNSSSDYLNLQRIYALCGTKLSEATRSDFVLIEPIFWPRLAGTKTAATATELAIYGAAVSGGDGYDGCNGNLTNAGTGSLRNICNYVNREFPNSLYISSNTDVYSAVSIKTSGRYTYKSIITQGYGCSILVVKNAITIKKVNINYHPNGGSVSAAGIDSSGFITLDGTKTFHTIYHSESDDPYNASTFGLTRTGYQFAGWKINGTSTVLDQSTSYTSTKYSHYNDSSKTTANTQTVTCHLYAEWTPNQARIAYHPNGGTATAAGLNTYGYLTLNGETYFHTVNHGSKTDPYNASTLGLTKTGYTFSGWEVKSTKKVLDQSTEYDSTVYAQYDDSSKTTANTTTVHCFLDAKWTVNQAKIRYSPNGGTVSGAQLDSNGFISLDGNTYFDTVNYGNKLTLRTAESFGMTKPGYVFAGWEVQGAAVILSENTEYESTIFEEYSDEYRSIEDNQTVICTLHAVWEKDIEHDITLVPIEPNVYYSENTEVYTSFWAVNATNKDYVPQHDMKMHFIVYDSQGKVLAEQTENFVVPGNDKNLVYFRWFVPNGYANQTLKVKANIIEGTKKYGYVERNDLVTEYPIFNAPNAQYESKAPESFVYLEEPWEYALSAKWWEWKYENGGFVKKQYGITNSFNDLEITAPKSPSAYSQYDMFYIKSGYGFECTFSPNLAVPRGCETDSVNKCTSQQLVYASFPEYGHIYGINNCRSFELVSGKFQFKEADGMGRQHFIPLYFPNERYVIQIALCNAWTPAGCMYNYFNYAIQVNGNIYEDWYIQH